MKRTRSQRGAAVVEFALLSGLLLVFLVGIFEFGFIWLQANYIGNAAREGARVASKIEGTSSDDIDDREAAARQAVELYLKSNFLFRDRNCQTSAINYPLNCKYPLDEKDDEISDFVVTTYTEEDLDVDSDGDGNNDISIPMAEVTVTVKTHEVWEPMLWPLLSALLPGVDYPADKLKQLTQSAAYAIGG